MIRCLLAHNYTMHTIGGSPLKMCSQCGKSFELVERVERGTGKVLEEHWREVVTSRKQEKGEKGKR